MGAATPTGLLAVPAVSALAATFPARAAKPVVPSKSDFEMVPFEGAMPAATDFTGFLDPETFASASISTSPPEACDPMSVAMRDAETLAAHSIVADDVEGVALDGGLRAVRLSRVQTAQGMEVPKGIIVVRGAAGTGAFAAQMPGAEDGDACALVAGIAERAPQGPEERVAALPSRYGPTGALRPIRVLMGNAVPPASGPVNRMTPGSTQPLVIVTRGLNQLPVAPENHASLSLEALGSLDGYGDVVPVETEEVTVGGKPGVRILADATSLSDGQAVRMLQTMAFPDGAYIRATGISPAASYAEHEADFRSLMDGLAPASGGN